MQYDGPLEPNTIIVGVPTSVKTKFELQYQELGLTAAESSIEALDLIKSTVEKYIPAGSVYVIVDEDNNVWAGIPVGAP